MIPCELRFTHTTIRHIASLSLISIHKSTNDLLLSSALETYIYSMSTIGSPQFAIQHYGFCYLGHFHLFNVYSKNLSMVNCKRIVRILKLTVCFI